MKLFKVTDPEFREYGRVIEGLDTAELIDEMKKTDCPEDGTIYVASDKKLEKLPIYNELKDDLWGGLPVEIGYCNGHNTKLNGLEYHRNSEINIPVGGNMILLLARQQDITKEHTLDTATCKAFLVPENTMVEVYATSLHYAPCQTSDAGFRCVVILPYGTNFDLSQKLENKTGEEPLLAAVNKWLIGHPEGGCAEGTFLGLVGKNLDTSEDLDRE